MSKKLKQIISKVKKYLNTLDKKYLVGGFVLLVALVFSLIYGIYKINADLPYTSLISGGTFDDNDNPNWYGYISSNDSGSQDSGNTGGTDTSGTDESQTGTNDGINSL